MQLPSGSHPAAGRTVTVKSGEFAGKQFRIEDYWSKVGGRSWYAMRHENWACRDYAERREREGTSSDNEVLYGKIDFLGKIIHVSQLDL